MDIKIFLLGFVSFIFGCILIIQKASKNKKLGLFEVRIFGWLICCIILGIYLMYSSLDN